MRFPYKEYDKMVAAERAAEIQQITPEKKAEEVKKDESVFDDPEKEIIKEPDPVEDQGSNEGGDPDAT